MTDVQDVEREAKTLRNPTFDENDPEIFGKDTEKNLYLCLENLCARNNRKNIYSVYGKTIEMKCLCDKKRAAFNENNRKRINAETKHKR